MQNASPTLPRIIVSCCNIRKEIIQGCQIAAYWLGVKDVIIAIEDNKLDAVSTLEKAVLKLQDRYPDIKIKVRTLPTRYPHGAETVQIRKLTGRVVPKGGLPFDAGVVVQNVQTVRFIATYLATGMPFVRRIITLDGSALVTPESTMYLLVPILMM